MLGNYGFPLIKKFNHYGYKKPSLEGMEFDFLKS